MNGKKTAKSRLGVMRSCRLLQQTNVLSILKNPLMNDMSTTSGRYWHTMHT